MKLLFCLLLFSVSALAQTGTMGTLRVNGALSVGTAGGGAILTGTSGVLYVGGVAVGTGGGGASTGTASLLIAGGTIGNGVNMGTGTATGGVLFAATGTTPQLSLANGTAGATFQLNSTGLLTIDPSGSTHRTYVVGDLYTDYFQLTGVNQGTPNVIIDSPLIDNTDAVRFTASALTTGTALYIGATGTGSGSANALKLENTRTGTGPNIGLTINATGTNGVAISIDAGKIATGTAGFSLPAANGTNGQVLTFDGAGGTSWTTISGGTGGGTPGGSSGQVQYNNGGAFGGYAISGTSSTVLMTARGTAESLTLASGTTTLLGSIVGGTAHRLSGAGFIALGTATASYGSITNPAITLLNPSGNPVTYPLIYSTQAYNTTIGFGGADRFQFDNTLGLSPATGVSNAYPLGTSTSKWGSLWIGTGTANMEGVLRLGTASSVLALGSVLTIQSTGTGGVVSTGTSNLVTPNVEMSHSTLASGTSVTVNFAGAAFQSVTATGTSLALSGTGYPATGSTARSVTLFITAGTAACTISIGTSGWRFSGTGTPGTMSANKFGTLALTATGSTGTTVRGSYSEEP